MTKLYIIRQKNDKTIKIGISDDVRKRLSQLQTGNPNRLELLRTLDCGNRETALRIEQVLHKRYASKRLQGEWFQVEPEEVYADIRWGLQFARAAGRAQHIEDFKEPAKPGSSPALIVIGIFFLCILIVGLAWLTKPEIFDNIGIGSVAGFLILLFSFASLWINKVKLNALAVALLIFALATLTIAAIPLTAIPEPISYVKLYSDTCALPAALLILFAFVSKQYERMKKNN